MVVDVRRIGLLMDNAMSDMNVMDILTDAPVDRNRVAHVRPRHHRRGIPPAQVPATKPIRLSASAMKAQGEDAVVGAVVGDVVRKTDRHKTGKTRTHAKVTRNRANRLKDRRGNHAIRGRRRLVCRQQRHLLLRKH